MIFHLLGFVFVNAYILIYIKGRCGTRGEKLVIIMIFLYDIVMNKLQYILFLICNKG